MFFILDLNAYICSMKKIKLMMIALMMCLSLSNITAQVVYDSSYNGTYSSNTTYKKYKIQFVWNTSEQFNAYGTTNLYGAGGNSGTAFLAVFDVHVGNQHVINRHDSSCYKLSKNELKRLGDYDSTHAKKGPSLYRDEFIVYDIAQCTINYIVEIK